MKARCGTMTARFSTSDGFIFLASANQFPHERRGIKKKKADAEEGRVIIKGWYHAMLTYEMLFCYWRTSERDGNGTGLRAEDFEMKCGPFQSL